MVEKLVKRTVWVAKCSCGQTDDVIADNPPKELLCKCTKEWCPYKEESFTAPEMPTKNENTRP